MSIKVSAIIPLYNGKNTIIRAINSILKQTVSVDEIIVIDDGSTDDSVQVINDFIIKNKLSCISIIKKSNGGVSSARNEGIKRARNEFVAFLDCDDEWVEHKIECQLNHIKDDSVVLVGGNHFLKKINRIFLRKAKKINEISLYDLLFKNYFQTSTVMVKRKAILNFNAFDESQTHAEEGQFYFNISKYGKLIHINEQLVIYDGGMKSGFGESGLSGNIIEMEKGELKNLKFSREKLGVNLFIYYFSVLFSFLKFCKRIIIVTYKMRVEK